MAAQAHLPLSRAADSITLSKQLPARAANALQGFSDILRGLRIDARTLPPAELVRKLNEKSGLLAALRATCKDEAQFQARRRNLDELADWFDGPKTSGPGELAAALALLYSRYFDPKATREEPRWMLVDVGFVRKLKQPIPLSLIRTRSEQLGEDFALIRKGTRLSVLPVTAAQWKILLSLEGKEQ
jgi:superfamily I DNA/RNA helicase